MDLFSILILAVFGVSDPPQYTVTERVDMIEVNHYHDQNGEFVLDQIVFYQWSHEDLRFQVEDYKLLKSHKQFPSQRVGDDYFSIWHDGNILRCVNSASLMESWTQHDPEHKERSILKTEFRRGLAELPAKTRLR